MHHRTTREPGCRALTPRPLAQVPNTGEEFGLHATVPIPGDDAPTGTPFECRLPGGRRPWQAPARGRGIRSWTQDSRFPHPASRVFNQTLAHAGCDPADCQPLRAPVGDRPLDPARKA